MTKLGLACGAGLLSLAIFVSCAGDDEKKVDRDADAGAGGLEGGSGGDVGAGGSQSPAAGQGGSVSPAAGQGGDAPLGGDGGSAPVAGGAGGAAGAAAGEAGSGGAPLDCPAQPGTFMYSCDTIANGWAPTYQKTTTRFALDVSSLEFPIVSGTLSFELQMADGFQCGTVNVQGSGNLAIAPVEQPFLPITERITYFDLVDACGGHHIFDVAGAPNCYELTGSNAFGDQALTCVGSVTNTCPAECE